MGRAADVPVPRIDQSGPSYKFSTVLGIGKKCFAFPECHSFRYFIEVALV